ncbi:DUF262 domain-containing protein [Nonomuraea sp. NPDC049646]|uniref:DUF262 domain-containing protein n=1 Tax=unclassified Nonomuraea TaxID=2593643 RepID=UPI0037926E1E
MKTTATNKKIRELLTAINNGTLIPQPEFQRRLVWTNRHKQLFIETVLEGLPFPEIFLCDGIVDLDTGAGSQLIVDGQQRITAIYQYFTESELLRLGDLTPYVDLDDEKKHAFLNYDVVVRDLGTLEIDEIRKVFHRMNSTNYSLNTMEVNHARFDGALKKAAEEISRWNQWDQHRVFTAADIRRMLDVSWCLTVIITLISGYFTRDLEHEAYLRKYNDDFPLRDDVEARIRKAADLIDSLGLDEKSRAWQKNDLFTLVVELARTDKTCVDPEGLARELNAFYASVDAVAADESPKAEYEADARRYHVDVISGSNERARRIRRGEIVSKLVAPYFG